MDLKPIPPFPVFDKTFSNMSIPGIEGFCVCRDDTESRSCLAFGREGENFIFRRFQGDVFGSELSIIEENEISKDTFDKSWELIEGLKGKEGFAGSEILDGQAFLVKVTTTKSTSHLILGNPEEMDSEFIREVGRKLNSLFV